MIIEAHVCNNEVIRKYPSIVCSLCRQGIDVLLPEEVIDDHNNNNKVVNATFVHGKVTRSS